jgi:hypothetical protein
MEAADADADIDGDDLLKTLPERARVKVPTRLNAPMEADHTDF